MEATQLLDRRFAGASLRALAELEGVSSPETMRQRLVKAKREHITEMAGKLMVARKLGEVLWLLVPGTNSEDLHGSLTYIDWLLRELEAVTFKVRVHLVTKPDGLAIGLEEYVDD